MITIQFMMVPLEKVMKYLRLRVEVVKNSKIFL